ncbi:TPA: hypothetical protein QDZ80_000234 [Stenotrophomonas maltophilia]|nr:hypothetical protein [Stenotrophomonas maltophilia]
MSKDTIIVPVVQATIHRSEYVTISDSFPKHELPILELIHGEDNVVVIDPDYFAFELPNNATQELQRLYTKYTDKYRPVVDQVFPRGARDVASELGMDVGKDSFTKQSEAVIESRLPPRPTAAATLSRPAPEDEGGEQPELTHAELREELTRLGIEHKGNAPKAELQALYDAAQAGAGTLGG